MDISTELRKKLIELAEQRNKPNQWDDSEFKTLYRLNPKAKGGLGEEFSAIIEDTKANNPFSGLEDLENGDEVKLACISQKGTYRFNRIKKGTDRINLVLVTPQGFEYRKTTRARLKASGKLTQQGKSNGDKWIVLSQHQIEMFSDLVIAG
jgi:hypothetical protein